MLTLHCNQGSTTGHLWEGSSPAWATAPPNSAPVQPGQSTCNAAARPAVLHLLVGRLHLQRLQMHRCWGNLHHLELDPADAALWTINIAASSSQGLERSGHTAAAIQPKCPASAHMHSYALNKKLEYAAYMLRQVCLREHASTALVVLHRLLPGRSLC